MTRAAGLARNAAASGIQCEILVNSPVSKPFLKNLAASELFENFLASGTISFSVIPSDLPPGSVNLPGTARQKAFHWCHQQDFHTVIVDTFPRGIGGELASWIWPKDRNENDLPPNRFPQKYLIARTVTQQYACSNRYIQAAMCYDKIFVPRDGTQQQWQAGAIEGKLVHTDPWLICHSEELYPKKTARQLLGCGLEKPLIAFLGTGYDKEISQMKQLYRFVKEQIGDRAEMIFFSPSECLGNSLTADFQSKRWPLLRWYPAFDLVVGNGGYNTVSECRVTQTKLFAFPRKRLYDRQRDRLLPGEVVEETDELVGKILLWLETETKKKVPADPSLVDPLKEFSSGAKLVVDQLLNNL